MNERTITQQALGKRIDKLTPADLTKYFKTPKKESDLREFKAYMDNPKGGEGGFQAVLRTICAFLNSEGGLLIWGAPIGKPPTQGQEKEFHGSLTHVVNDYGDDQLSDMVFDSISPSPQGIKIKKLTHRGQRAYVFEVPRSPYAPHQVKEKGAYWFRFNATTKPAPHHFVEALMRRVRFPDLGVHLRMGHVQRLEKRRSISVGFDVVCMNRSVLQNEQDITVSIHVSHGRIKEMGGGSNLELGSQSRTLVISNARDLLHHGIDFRVSIQVDIPFKGIEPPEKLRVQLGVAGRFSPIKYSEYLVQVSDIHDLPADQLSKAIKTDVLFDSEAEGPTRLEASHFNRRFH